MLAGREAGGGVAGFVGFFGAAAFAVSFAASRDFLIAAAVVGWLVERGWSRNFASLLGAMTIGHVLIFVAGVSYLTAFSGVGGALSSGLYPFILGSIVKTVAAAASVKAIQGVTTHN